MMSVFLLFIGYLITGCEKNQVNVLTVQQSINPVSFVAVENATDSGTIIPKATTKSGFTAIVQRNNLKDSSAIDSIKLYYQTIISSVTVTVDSSVLTSANLADTSIKAPFTYLVTFYYTFTVPTANLVTGKTYSVVGNIYTHDGNVGTGTYSNLFKW